MPLAVNGGMSFLGTQGADGKGGFGYTTGIQGIKAFRGHGKTTQHQAEYRVLKHIAYLSYLI